jgi:hypothetical protein
VPTQRMPPSSHELRRLARGSGKLKRKKSGGGGAAVAAPQPKLLSHHRKMTSVAFHPSEYIV